MQSLARLLKIESTWIVFGRCTCRGPLPRIRRFDRTLSTNKPTLRGNTIILAQNGVERPQNSNLQSAVSSLPTTAIGQVMAAQANFVRVKIDALEGSDIPPPQSRLLCVVRALLKKMKREVLVGDRVRVIGIDWTDGRGMVEEVLPRNSKLSEPPVANVNHVLLVFSSAMPPLQPSAATRYLVAAEYAGLPITVALNKVDLMTEEEARAEVERVRGWGYKTVPVSVVNEQGLNELEKALYDRVTVVAGPSGAGKSSIINALRLRAVGVAGTLESMAAQPSGQTAHDSDSDDDNEDEKSMDSNNNNNNNNNNMHSYVQTVPNLDLLAVGSVSERIGRGKHTTRNVTLVEMGSGGLLVDTPGFNQPSLNIPASQLGQYFPEIRRVLSEEGEIVRRCTFSNCQHISEPGCVVKGDWERYELYVGLHVELRQLEEEAAKRAVSKQRREGTARLKSRGGGKMAVEARLETKTHRRVSRRSVKQNLSQLDVGSADDVL